MEQFAKIQHIVYSKIFLQFFTMPYNNDTLEFQKEDIFYEATNQPNVLHLE